MEGPHAGGIGPVNENGADSGRGFTVACIVFAVAAIGVFVFAASRLMAAIGGVGSGI